MMATTPEPRERELLSCAAPYRQDRLSAYDRKARLVSLTLGTLAMSFASPAAANHREQQR